MGLNQKTDACSAFYLFQNSMPRPTWDSSIPRSTRCSCCGRGPVLWSQDTGWLQVPREEASHGPTTWDLLPLSTFSGTCSLALSTQCTSWQLKKTCKAQERLESSQLVSITGTHSSSLVPWPFLKTVGLCWKWLLWTGLQKIPFEVVFQQNCLGNIPCSSFWTFWQ